MSVIWDWCNRLGNASLGVNNMGFPRLDRLSLQVDMNALLLGLALLNGVFLDAVDEFFSRARVGDVFDTDVDALLHVTVSDSLVNDNTNSGFGHVIDHSGLAVVDFVGHTLLDCAVGFDIDDVTDSVRLHVRAQSDHALLAVLAAERIARAGSETCGVTHCDG